MNPQVFTYGETQVRTIIKNGEVWFIAKDVCSVLDIKNSRDALGRLDEDEKGVVLTDTLGGKQQMLCVNEAGLYNLVLRSRKPEAKQFKRWVTHEVLPTIRKTGGYVSNDEMFINTYLPFADEQTKMMFRGVLETVRRQNERIAAMKPKADYFDALVDRNLLTNFRDTAKELEVKERYFIEWLLDNKFVYRDQKGKLKPYAQYVPELFKLKEFARNGKADVQTLITPRGKETFRLLLKNQTA
ncbi:phage antirepressor Ant [Geobacillus thermodenitrificans]|jgi:prophage antirepressor-like protein|uniref:Phage antirepressor Ant n=1 Tax=Geobacillus thermodenitrificans TaxID=33940 RepID=A0ABY9Q816_GEOTD|nr:phage antirepressor Ant [Geobacillus thermodenitrificans]ATO38724.1 antirepressor [Geobacillus thermodenitrificans]WMV75019.1 phage antirepressor Ant [Geobacillus thermodenitrificans]